MMYFEFHGDHGYYVYTIVTDDNFFEPDIEHRFVNQSHSNKVVVP